MIIIFVLFFSLASKGNSEQEAVSSVTLNSISVDNTSEASHLRLLVKARKAGNFEPVLDTKRAAQKTLEFFFIGLIMNNEALWVNLNPDEPKRIIDSSLGNTDLGRIMLNADFRLKEDVSNMINPQTSKTGKEFWSRLYDKAQELGVTDKIPVVTRLWIVPAETTVYETDNQFSIVKSKLKVRLEPGYLSQGTKIDRRQQELQDFAPSLMEELVLPELNKRVNEAYAYADLREVYNALILAQWYKQKFNPYTDSLLRTVNFDILQDTEINYSYSPEQIYYDYIESLKQGEYSFTEKDAFASPFYTVITTRHYFSGGVDFRDIKVTKTDAQPQVDENSFFLSCDLFIPQGIARPLQYAKSQLELTVGNSLQDRSSIALVKNLPAIAPVRFAEANMQSLNSIDRTERLLLSKL